MANTSQWVEGARPRTLPAAVAPVLAGTGVALHADSAVWWKAALALVVALALQVAVNYANDYSDGIRGTDSGRVGPLRLVGSGAASARRVKQAACMSFGVGAAAGLVLAATTAWWLVAVGAVAMMAAWFYTGGSNPYGYSGFGEIGVFVFFGLVAVMGTAYVQTETLGGGIGWLSSVLGAGVGALACAILVANNLRDIQTDELAGKRTLAVVLGDDKTRGLFALLHGVAYAVAVIVSALMTGWLLLALLAVPLSGRALAVVRRRGAGPQLIPVLKDTGLAELVYATGVFAGFLIASA